MQLDFMDFEFAEARKASVEPSQGINANIDLANATLKNKVLQVNFVYTATYLPHQSFLRFGGVARFSGPEAAAAHAQWEKEKRITGAAGEQILNSINFSASVNAVFLARIFNLTPPLMPPTITLEEKPAEPAKKKKK